MVTPTSPSGQSLSSPASTPTSCPNNVDSGAAKAAEATGGSGSSTGGGSKTGDSASTNITSSSSGDTFASQISEAAKTAVSEVANKTETETEAKAGSIAAAADSFTSSSSTPTEAQAPTAPTEKGGDTPATDGPGENQQTPTTEPPPEEQPTGDQPKAQEAPTVPPGDELTPEDVIKNLKDNPNRTETENRALEALQGTPNGERKPPTVPAVEDGGDQTRSIFKLLSPEAQAAIERKQAEEAAQEQQTTQKKQQAINGGLQVDPSIAGEGQGLFNQPVGEQSQIGQPQPQGVIGGIVPENVQELFNEQPPLLTPPAENEDSLPFGGTSTPQELAENIATHQQVIDHITSIPEKDRTAAQKNALSIFSGEKAAMEENLAKKEQLAMNDPFGVTGDGEKGGAGENEGVNPFLMEAPSDKDIDDFNARREQSIKESVPELKQQQEALLDEARDLEKLAGKTSGEDAKEQYLESALEKRRRAGDIQTTLNQVPKEEAKGAREWAETVKDLAKEDNAYGFTKQDGKTLEAVAKALEEGLEGKGGGGDAGGAKGEGVGSGEGGKVSNDPSAQMMGGYGDEVGGPAEDETFPLTQQEQATMEAIKQQLQTAEADDPNLASLITEYNKLNEIAQESTPAESIVEIKKTEIQAMMTKVAMKMQSLPADATDAEKRDLVGVYNALNQSLKGLNASKGGGGGGDAGGAKGEGVGESKTGGGEANTKILSDGERYTELKEKPNKTKEEKEEMNKLEKAITESARKSLLGGEEEDLPTVDEIRAQVEALKANTEDK